jgi:hypothetical protein
MRRAMLAMLLGSVVVVGFAAPAAMAQSRATITITCDVAGKANISPGLLFSSQQESLTANGSLSNCTSSPSISGLSGTFVAKGSGTMSCTSGSASGYARINWLVNGVKKYSSILSITLTVSPPSLTGTVIQGFAKGETLSGNISLQPTSGNCLTNPVTTANLSGSATIS